MLDIEVTEDTSKTALDVVSVDELARHLRLSPALKNNATWVGNMTDAITEAVDKLHGLTGELNRMVLPCTITRYLTSFPPRGRPIYLPYPELISVDAVTIEDGSSPANIISPSAYVVKKPLVPEIHPIGQWPSVTKGPRAVSVTYKAGYSKFPPSLKRYVKILAAHFLENPEATINDQRQLQVNRRTEFGVDDLRAALRVPPDLCEWGEYDEKPKISALDRALIGRGIF